MTRRLFGGLVQTMALGVKHQAQLVGYLELRKYGTQVIPDCALRHAQFLGDTLTVQAIRHKHHDLSFASR
jgi:hypothetical protein